MTTLEEKKQRLEILLKEFEGSKNVTLQKKAKAYREKFTAVSIPDNQALLFIDSKELVKELIAARTEINSLEYKDLTFKVLIKIVDTITRLKNDKNAALKDKKIKAETSLEITSKWENLSSALDTLDEKLIVNGTTEIEKLLELENDESRKKAADRFKEIKNAYDVIKDLYTLCDKGLPSKDDAYAELEKLVNAGSLKIREDSDGKEMEKIDFEFKILHYKKKIKFEKKEKIIEKIVDETNIAFDELVDERADLKRFKKKLTGILEEKVKRELKQLDKILKKEEERGDESDLTLPVYFKKITENGMSGWIIDVKKTVAPKEVKQKGEAVLSHAPEVVFAPKPELSGNVFISKLDYLIPITRAAFKHKTVDWLSVIGSAVTIGGEVAIGISGQNPITTSESSTTTTTTTTGGVPVIVGEETTEETIKDGDKYTTGEAIKHVGEFVKGVEGSIKEETEGEASDSLAWSLTFKYDTKTNKVKVEAKPTGDLKNIEYKKVHRYHSNMNEASLLFETEVIKTF